MYVCIRLDDIYFFFFFSSRRRHTRSLRHWSSDVCSSDLSPWQKKGVAKTERTQTQACSRVLVRRWLPVLWMSLALCGFTALDPQRVAAAEPAYPRHTRENFRHDMPKTVRADHPAIVPVANAIRAVTKNPLEQLVMVNDVSHLLVDYDDDLRVY